MMSKRKRFIAAMMVGLLAFSACKKEESVGNKELLKQAEANRKEAEAKAKLDAALRAQELAASQTAGAIGNSPSPTAKATGTAGPQETVVEIALTKEGPFYNPGPNIRVGINAKVRIVNKDDKVRRFTTTDGPEQYDSGNLAVGKTFEFVASFKGKFELTDPNVPFAVGSFEVL